MGTPAIFAGRRTKLLTADGLLLRTQAIIDNDGDFNPIKNGHFEITIAPWIAYQNPAATTPLNGTGGSPATSIARTTISSLQGLGSGLYTKDAANRQGEGFSYQFDIPPAMQSQTVAIEFDYDLSVNYNGTTEKLDMYLYDVTNATVISPFSTTVPAGKGNFSTTFATSATGITYRICFHLSAVGNQAWTLLVDNVKFIRAIEAASSTNGFQNITAPNGIVYQSGAVGQYDGEVNPITNGHFEINAAGWATYADAPAVQPVNGTGGVPATVTFARTTSSALQGGGSGLITKAASNGQGEGVSYDFTLPLAYRGQNCLASFDCAVSGAYTGPVGTEYVGIYIYDVTNSTLIIPEVISLVGSTLTFQTAFDTVSSGAQLRLILHVAGTGTSAWTLKLDRVMVTRAVTPAFLDQGRTRLASPQGIVTRSGQIIDYNGQVNYCSNSHFEFDTAGWAEYADAPGTIPVDGTGGIPNVTLTRNTSSPLRGNADGLLSKDAANRQGQGWSFDFSIPTVDRGKRLGISFDYDFTDANYNNGDVGVYIYDITNAVIITPQVIPVPKLKGTFYSAFDSVSSSGSYRLIFHVATTNATTLALHVDCVILYGSNIPTNVLVEDNLTTVSHPWLPEIGGSTTFGSATYTTQEGKWRRVGDCAEITFNTIVNTYTIGSAGTYAVLKMPPGLTIDTSKTLTYAILGEGMFFGATRVPLYYTNSAGGNFITMDPTRTSDFPFNGTTPGNGYGANGTIVVPIVEFAGTQPSLVGFSRATNTSAGIVNPSEITGFVYGAKYTLTASVGTNITALTDGFAANYVRIGPMVTVWGTVATMTATAGAGTTSRITINLPVPLLNAGANVVGSGSVTPAAGSSGEPAIVYNNGGAVTVQWNANAIANLTTYFNFTYEAL